MSIHERHVTPATASPEDLADIALGEGDVARARDILHRAITETYTHGSKPELFHHLSLKAVMLPMYDLVYHPPTADHFEEASKVYGWIGQLLEHEIEILPQQINGYRAYTVGNISELVIAALSTRNVTPDSRYVPIPAKKRDNIAAHEPVDFQLAPVYGNLGFSRPFQVKTLVTEVHWAGYKNSVVRLVGLNEFDPLYHAPYAHDSLAQTILRELRRESTVEDSTRLETAVSRLHAVLGITSEEGYTSSGRDSSPGFAN